MGKYRFTFQRDFHGELVLIALGAVVLLLAARMIWLAIREGQLSRRLAIGLAVGVGGGVLGVAGIAGAAAGARTGCVALGIVLVNASVLWAWAIVLACRRTDTESLMTIVLATMFLGGVDAAVFIERLRQPVFLVLPAVVLCLATVAVFYRSLLGYLGAARVGVLIALRCLAILVLLALVFRPVVTVVPLGNVRPVVLMLVDSSKSMSVQDAKNSPTRYEDVVQTFQSELSRVEKSLDLKYYVFDASLRAVEHLDDLASRPPDGEATNLALALREAVARHPGTEVFALCALTDGNHNTPGDPVAAARSLGVPLYAVGVGTEEMRSDKLQDISIAAVDAPEETVAHSVCKIRAHIAADGLPNRTVEVLLKDGPQPIDRQTLVLSDKQRVQVVELTYKPTTTGRKKLTVSVPVDPAELISENNAHDVHLLVTDPQIKVLYIEGAVRPEYKFLRRYLSTDPSVELATLIQVQPPLFTAGGTVGGRPLSGFPKTAEEFKAFDVFLIGDLDRTCLSKGQMDLLVDAVRAGKGFLMIGGAATLGPGGYAGTPIEGMLPVAVGSRSKDRQETREFVPRLTAEGKAHPVFQGLADFFGSGATTATSQGAAGSTLPPLQGCVVVDGAKAGAAVLAEHPASRRDGRPLIVLAVQSYGSGRTAVFTADTTWKWYMFRRALGMQSPYHRFWGQLIRWLANSELKEKGPESGVQVQVVKSFFHPGEKVEVSAKVRDEEGQAYNFASVAATIRSPEGKTVELPMARRDDRVGAYQVTYEPNLPGAYKIEVTAQKQNTPLGKDTTDFVLGRPSAEFEKLSLDVDRLTKMAGAGGGEYLRLPGLSDLMNRLIRRHEMRGAGSRQPTEYALFSASTHLRKHLKMGVCFGLFVLLVTGEWLLRRRWQLS